MPSNNPEGQVTPKKSIRRWGRPPNSAILDARVKKWGEPKRYGKARFGIDVKSEEWFAISVSSCILAPILRGSMSLATAILACRDPRVTSDGFGVRFGASAPFEEWSFFQIRRARETGDAGGAGVNLSVVQSTQSKVVARSTPHVQLFGLVGCCLSRLLSSVPYLQSSNACTEKNSTSAAVASIRSHKSNL